MTDYRDYEAIMTVIQKGIEVARDNPKAGEPASSDNYVAWCVLQEFRRAGWTIERSHEPPPIL